MKWLKAFTQSPDGLLHAVGTDPLACYEGETVSWEFTVTDPTGNLTTLAGQTIKGVIKVSAAASDPPLIGPITCTITSATNPMKFKADIEMDLDPGTYVFSSRREQVGPTIKWQYTHNPVTVINSASQD